MIPLATVPRRRSTAYGVLGWTLTFLHLSADDLKAANAWKIAYLRRLRTEKTDESYINAYVKAWGVDPKVVFTEP